MALLLLLYSCATNKTSYQPIEDLFQEKRANFWRSDFKHGDGTKNCHISEEQAKSGHSSYKFVLKKGDHVTTSDVKNLTERREFYLKDEYRDLPDQIVHYEFSFFLPKKFPIIKARLVMGQWIHLDDPMIKLHNPHISNRFKNGKFYVSLKLRKNGKVDEKKFYPENGSFKLGSWNTLRYKIYFTTKKSGYLQVSLNGKAFANYEGPTTNYDLPSTFKCCLYRDQTEEDMILYFDSFKREVQGNL